MKDPERSLLFAHTGTVNALYSKDISQTKHKSLRITVIIN